MVFWRGLLEERGVGRQVSGMGKTRVGWGRPVMLFGVCDSWARVL